MSWSMQQISEIQERANDSVKAYLTFGADWDAIMAQVGNLVISSYGHFDGELSLYVVGTWDRFQEVFKALRNLGYNTDREGMPAEGEKVPEFRIEWRKEGWDGARMTREAWVGLSFTSTICRRVQVSTEMKEVPVFDIVCQDEEVHEQTNV